MFQLPLVLSDGPLPGLRGEIFLDCLTEGDAGLLRLRLLLLQPELHLCELRFGIVLRPFAAVLPGSLPVDGDGEPPRQSLRPLARELPLALRDFSHAYRASRNGPRT